MRTVLLCGVELSNSCRFPEMPSDDARTGLWRSTRKAVPWREVTRFRMTMSQAAATIVTTR